MKTPTNFKYEKWTLSAILEVFSDSADPTRFLPSVRFWQQVRFDFYRQSAGIECQQVLSDF